MNSQVIASPTQIDLANCIEPRTISALDEIQSMGFDSPTSLIPVQFDYFLYQHDDFYRPESDSNKGILLPSMTASPSGLILNDDGSILNEYIPGGPLPNGFQMLADKGLYQLPVFDAPFLGKNGQIDSKSFWDYVSNTADAMNGYSPYDPGHNYMGTGRTLAQQNLSQPSGVE